MSNSVLWDLPVSNEVSEAYWPGKYKTFFLPCVSRIMRFDGLRSLPS